MQQTKRPPNPQPLPLKIALNPRVSRPASQQREEHRGLVGLRGRKHLGHLAMHDTRVPGDGREQRCIRMSGVAPPPIVLDRSMGLLLPLSLFLLSKIG